MADRRTGPPRHKLAVVSWIAVYPLITILLVLLRPHVGGYPIPVQTLILTLLMVPLQTYVVMPVVSRLFAKWLDRQ